MSWIDVSGVDVSGVDVVRLGGGPGDPVVVLDLFTSTQCERLTAEGDDQWRPSLVTTYSDGRLDQGDPRAHQRAIRSTEEFGPDRSHPDVAGALMSAVLSVNEITFAYDVSASIQTTQMTVLRYDAERHDHFGLHRDLGPANSTRKLSFSVQLSDESDYVGGDLVFPGGGVRAPRQRGSLTVFPAFLPHQVTTMHSGIRHSLVGWVHGPAFR